MKYLFIPSNDVRSLNKLKGTFTLKRLKKGLKKWKTKKYDKILVAGGLCYPAEQQTKTLGKLMKDWLISKGISADKIIAETESLDTYQNISGVMELISEDSNPEITVVTHWQHAWRFKITFWRMYGLKIKLIKMFYWVNLPNFVVEWVFLLIHLFDKNGNSWLVRKNRIQRASYHAHNRL